MTKPKPWVIYLSGPMRGLPNLNYGRFNLVARRLRHGGATVINPAENFGGDQDLPIETYMKHDLLCLLSADQIHLLPGWEDSAGAKLERSIAEALGLTVTLEDR